MRIFISGKEGTGWSIDQDYALLASSIARIGGRIAANPFTADVVHNIWWNSIFHKKFIFHRFGKRILLTASNFITDDDFSPNTAFHRATRLSTKWIAPSLRQLNLFANNGLEGYYLPFQVAQEFYSPVPENVDRVALMRIFSIPPRIAENRVIIGSFQRDSLGSDLLSPKWEKGADILVDILKDMPREKYLLLLAGPRRHYLISECQKNDIPFHYIGRITDGDDSAINSLDSSKIRQLYLLSDIYLVTSRKEGGPKAILEGAASGVLMLSTDVGLARDILGNELVFSNIGEYRKCLYAILDSDTIFKQFKDRMYPPCLTRFQSVCGQAVADARLASLYERVLNEN